MVMGILALIPVCKQVSNGSKLLQQLPSITYLSQVLPKGSRVVSTDSHGVSFWANTGRIDVELVTGEQQSFFIKVLSNELGANMVHGEFESMNTIYGMKLDFVPKPIA